MDLALFLMDRRSVSFHPVQIDCPSIVPRVLVAVLNAGLELVPGNRIYLLRPNFRLHDLCFDVNGSRTVNLH